MKALLILLFMLAGTGLQGQKDFDYTFHTTRHSWIIDDTVKNDTVMNLPIYRTITKVADRISVSSIADPTSVRHFQVQYVGWSDAEKCLIYAATDEQERDIIIRVNPLSGVAAVLRRGRKDIYH